MKGNEKVIEFLKEALKAELTAINQYFLHSRMCANWGYQKMAAYMRKESIEEMHRAYYLPGESAQFARDVPLAHRQGRQVAA